MKWFLLEVLTSYPGEKYMLVGLKPEGGPALISGVTERPATLPILGPYESQDSAEGAAESFPTRTFICFPGHVLCPQPALSKTD